nr:immunoglobulin light chain junction region [Macaca mulatta]
GYYCWLYYSGVQGLF